MGGPQPAANVRVHATLHGFAAAALPQGATGPAGPASTPKERELDLPEGARADDAPRACGIRPELVLVFRDGKPIAGDEPLGDGDRIRILRVVSGGR